MFKLLLKAVKFTVLVLLLLVLAIPVGLLIGGVERQPLVWPAQTMNYQHVTRLHAILKEHDPRRMHEGEVKQLITAENDLNLMLQYGLSSIRGAGAKVVVQQDQATLHLSLGLQALRIDRYVNIAASLVQHGPLFRLERVRVGSLSIPDFFPRYGAAGVHNLLLKVRHYREVIETIRELEFLPQQVRLVYQWRPELLKEIAIARRDFFSSPSQQARVDHYLQEIAKITRQLPIVTPAETVLSPLFESAYRRSRNAEQAVAENSALLSALGQYLIGNTAGQLLGADHSHAFTQVRRRYPTLRGRYDLAQHFILSAYLVNTAGQGVAEGIGLFKEFKDSQGGSGFSFADLAADRAGQRFAELALHADTAKLLQQAMRRVTEQGFFMPRVDRLPEGIQEIEFKARYGSLNSDDYRRIDVEIDNRLARCDLFDLVTAVVARSESGSESSLR